MKADLFGAHLVFLVRPFFFLVSLENYKAPIKATQGFMRFFFDFLASAGPNGSFSRHSSRRSTLDKILLPL